VEVTSNLEEFGFREIKMAKDLLNAWVEEGLPDGFYSVGVKIAFNKRSGLVFLTNEDHQVAMMDGDKLEMFYYCHQCGAEGFSYEIDWDRESYLCGECCDDHCDEDSGDEDSGSIIKKFIVKDF